jgi:cobalt-zinc-cadmium efflux system outer membrane protein
MHAARREVELLRGETLPAARAAFDASNRAFREGATDYTTVLDTERTFIDAQRQEVEALAEYQQLVNQIEGLTGQPMRRPDGNP